MTIISYDNIHYIQDILSFDQSSLFDESSLFNELLSYLKLHNINLKYADIISYKTTITYRQLCVFDGNKLIQTIDFGDCNIIPIEIITTNIPPDYWHKNMINYSNNKQYVGTRDTTGSFDLVKFNHSIVLDQLINNITYDNNNNNNNLCLISTHFIYNEETYKIIFDYTAEDFYDRFYYIMDENTFKIKEVKYIKGLIELFKNFLIKYKWLAFSLYTNEFPLCTNEFPFEHNTLILADDSNIFNFGY